MKKVASTTITAKETGCSIYTVAEKAGVSVVTVSRVFNDYPHVSSRMRERVFAAAREIGYSPRVVSKPKVLAGIVGHLEQMLAGDYKTRLILHLIQYAAMKGYMIEFIPFSSAELATKSLVDGIIEIGLTEEEMASLTQLPNVPMAVINKRPLHTNWLMVGSDHDEEAQLATRHLRRQGHDRIAMILDELTGWGVEQRQSGYRHIMQKRAVKFSPLIISANKHKPAEIVEIMMEHHCTACINFTDNLGFPVLDCLTNSMGLRIPEDFSIICLENKSTSSFFRPPLTTIEQPLKQIAKTVIHGVVNMQHIESKKRPRLFHSRLIERASVGPPPK